MDIVAEISLHFENQTGGTTLGIRPLPTEQLPGERMHAGRGFTGTDGPENRTPV